MFLPHDMSCAAGSNILLLLSGSKEVLNMMDFPARIRTALGQEPADLVLTDARVVDVFTGQIVRADVAIRGGTIAGVGHYEGGAHTVSLEGRYLVPGFINAHCHVESSMVVPEHYCREELRHGVTTLITDPHEIANVAGMAGIRYMLQASEHAPVNYYVQLPSCVPATPFEHAGAVLTAGDLLALKDHPRVLGLGEMMNYPGLAACDADVLAKLEAFADRIIDGHAPGITGRSLQACAAAGIATDHESVTWAEAREKLRSGIAVLVREGSASRNLTDLLTGALADRASTRRMAFCTDDKHLADIRREGTIRHNAAMAIALGLPPAQAIQMATLNAAEIYGLRHLGAIAPGYRADLVVLDDLERVTVSQVYKDGQCVVRDGEVLLPEPAVSCPDSILHSVHLPVYSAAQFRLPDRAQQPVLAVQPGQILTRQEWVPAGSVEAAIAAGTLRKLAVVERHHASGHIGVGLIRGYGLRHGAVATTVAHDSHNLIVVADNDDDLLLAVRTAQEMDGGYCLVRDGAVVGRLPLPVGGLMSAAPTDEFIPALEHLLAQARAMGVAEGIDPFTTLSFVALPVIPEVRLTDLGMFDVTKFAFI